MSVEPRRRQYGPVRGTGKGIGDTSDTLRVRGGIIFGAGVGTIWGMFILGSVTLGLFVGGPIGALFFYVVLRLWLGASSKVVAGALLPEGSTTAYKRQYSDAEAAAVRGDYEPAVVAYARYVMEDPSDPEPYFRIARIYRNQLQDFEQAAHWYRRARLEATLDAGRDLQATQDLVEIYIHKLRQPRKAMPELARLIERFPHTPPARAAAEELGRLRALLAAEGEDGESLTGRYYKGD